MKKFTLPFVTIPAALIFLTGCGSEPPVGKDVVVQFDRSALGAAANLPISPTTGSINGAVTSLSGKLHSITEEWVIIEQSTAATNGTLRKKFWIPRDKVLLIQQEGLIGN